MEIINAVQFIVGLFYFFAGLSLLLHCKIWLLWIKNIQEQGERASLKYGLLDLVAGAAIIGLHPVWQGPGIIVTIIGYTMLLIGIFYTLCPRWLPKMLDMLMPSMKLWLRLSGGLALLLGVALLSWYWLEKEDSFLVLPGLVQKNPINFTEGV